MGKKNKKSKDVPSEESPQANPFQEGDLTCPAPDYKDVKAAGNFKGDKYTKEQKNAIVKEKRRLDKVYEVYGPPTPRKRGEKLTMYCRERVVKNVELLPLAEKKKKKRYADSESSAGSSSKQPAAWPKVASDSDSEPDWEALEGRNKKMMGEDMEEQGQGKVPSEELGAASTSAEQPEEAELSQQMQNKRVTSPTQSKSCCSSRKRLRTDMQ